MPTAVIASLRRTFTPLALPNLRLFLTGQSISLIGTWLQSTAQALLVFQLSHGKAQPLGIAAACTALPILVFGPVVGSWADRIPRKPLLIATQAIELLLAAALAYLVHSGKATLGAVYLLAFLLGCVESIFFPAAQRFLKDLAGHEHVRVAVGLNSTIINVARFAGPTLAGWLIGQWGMTFAFAINSLSFLAVIASLFAVRESRSSSPATPQAGWGFARSSRLLMADMRLIGIFITIALMNIFGQSCYALAPALEHGDARATGLLLGAAGLGSLVSALFIIPFLHDHRRPGILLSLAISWMGLWLGFTAMLPTLTFQLAAMFALGLSTTVIFVTTLGLLQTIPPTEAHGSLFGMFAAIFNGTQPLAALLLGTLADHGSVARTIERSASLEVAGGLILLTIPAWRHWRLHTEGD
ncbi:MFS transporter [Granulicella sp. S156]|jgi:MFS family permease|uniref:MFS transporter n=1 Tax=Granulicella sp. S156 TaxID=1747224 RepID=UPI00131DAA11|nr:MFS transporter [Granulicella sp. S156]